MMSGEAPAHAALYTAPVALLTGHRCTRGSSSLSRSSSSSSSKRSSSLPADIVNASAHMQLANGRIEEPFSLVYSSLDSAFFVHSLCSVF
jgi:hypothetical protein